ncbi:hypothetical protein [Paractinoplanes hotanensis]|uniref:Uncharacterized protein n=1 Tax=Paractinoplanes hotanensis TaxID=2906497 RepID=A0ABT0Y555_9ACTN|nr:hypothetical protein [Actinoplanes hotanensis]MCM4081156.1 hypothetical protein [Actinoplanes hotanensis]
MNTTSSHPAPVAGFDWRPRTDALGDDLPQFLALVAEVCEGATAAVTLAGFQGHLELLGEGREAQGSRHRWQVDAINRNIGRLCETVDRLLLMPQPPFDQRSLSTGLRS